MYSLNGENFHYGTPVNPKANNRIPGGSSSGSAVCVAAGLTDFAIGTDTGGLFVSLPHIVVFLASDPRTALFRLKVSFLWQKVLILWGG